MSEPTRYHTSGGGVSFAGLLTVLFVGLKLTDNIDWSWWWVLSPLWISTLLAFAILLPIIAWLIWDDRR